MFGILSVNDRFLHRSFAMQDTKERILQTALTLFARDGYEAVSVSAIADVLDITKGALYRHYENKRAIFDAIVARMEAEDAQRATEYHVPDGTISEMEQAYRDDGIAARVQPCAVHLLDGGSVRVLVSQNADSGAVPRSRNATAL